MIRIGTRNSKLALIQTNLVKEKLLAAFPEETVEIVPIITKGDKELHKSLDSFGGKGVFTKEIEDKLLDGSIDLAVHSAKDLPMELEKGLEIGALLKREDARDVLVTRKEQKTDSAMVIGTSSLRRELQIKEIYPNVRVRSIRGNVPTRIEKLRKGEYDGIILAAAGLKRLGLEKELDLQYEYFSVETFVPAAGQGILAIECRENSLKEVLEALNEEDTRLAFEAERAFLASMGGGCNAPCGIYCKKMDIGFMLYGMYGEGGGSPKYIKKRVEKEQELSNQINTIAKELLIKKVSIVGAGPGKEELLTQKALQCIKKADVIIYDNLISPSILNEAKISGKLIYVGKRAGTHYMKQEEINQLIIKYALEGKYVVRLKGGDPFIFGRGAEEAQALSLQGIPFEIVSGVSSAYSVPAFANIPVTHRNVASSVHIITGREGNHKEIPTIDYETVAKQEGTLVFLMGLSHLRDITQGLIAGGKEATTSVAVIQSGGGARQKVVVGALENIVEKSIEAQLTTPAIIVVGEVVNLREEIGKEAILPLTGKRVLLTGTRQMVGKIKQELELKGAEGVAISLVETCDVEQEGQEEVLSSLEGYQWGVFVSPSGVNSFFNRLKKYKIDRRKLAHIKFAVVGEATAKALEEQGYFYDFMPSKYTSKDLAKEWIPTLSKKDTVLFVRGKNGADYLERKLQEKGISFQDVFLYETKQDTRRAEELNRHIVEADYVVVSSGSGARALRDMLNQETLKVKFIAIGPETNKVLEEVGFTEAIVSKEASPRGIVKAILGEETQEK